MMTPNVPKLPTRTVAWVLTILGVLALAVSVWASLPMLAVEVGQKHVSAGGAEYFVALFFALPLLVLSALILGICTLVGRLRSWVSCGGLVVAVLGLVGWVVLVVFGTPG